MKKLITNLGLASAIATAPVALGADVAVTTNIEADVTWTADNVYCIDRPIFVRNNATLTIEPGTVIVGSRNLMNQTAGSLVITREGMIDAQGTAALPIVFTGEAQAEFLLQRDLNNDQFIEDQASDPYTEGGQWGGVIILGSAPINFFNGSTRLDETTIEGFPVDSSTTDTTYGGNDPADSSGIMRYVSIQFGGVVFAQDNEINGLTLGGVGSGTTLEFIEVIANTDDAFEFFGGTVNTKNLVAAFCDDESFDIDQGHQGRHQFWFALQSTSSDNGTEADGGDGSNSPDKTQTPLTNTVIYNATYIGGGPSGKSGQDAFRLKDNFAGQFHNSLFHDFTGSAIRIDDSSTAGQVGGNLNFQNNTFGTFGSGSLNDGSAGEMELFEQAGNTVIGSDPGIRAFTRNVDGQPETIDPRAVNRGSLTTSTLTPVGDFANFSEVDYRGAFGANNWATGWTFLSQNGFFNTSPVASRARVDVVANIETNTTWSTDNNYFIDRPIFVRAGATLTIEPGVHVFGARNLQNQTAGSLVITRDGMINASGTAAEPIVFTSVREAELILGTDLDGDSVTQDVPLDPLVDGGDWGGVIILGSAPINFFDGSTRLTETTIEGFPVDSSTTDTTYGGSNTADSSGIMRYVSIRFGGVVFAQDNEINGLTLGGVGSGTTLEFIEVVANTDDAFEFFGGTVNTNNLVALFCQDESFDIDQGHQGVHQFWFALQSESSDNGTEADGGDGSNGPDKTQTPLTNTMVYNATYIGGGPNGKSGQAAFRLKDNFAGQFHNSVFHDFTGPAIRIDDSSTAGQVGGNLLFTNNTFGTFGGGAVQDMDMDGTNPDTDPDNEQALFDQVGNSAIDTDPLLRGLYALRGGLVDPRPRNDSPLFTANGATLRTVPTGLETTDYRGAFGADNWANGWTYASLNGILVDCPAITAPAGSSTGGSNPDDLDGDGVVAAIETLIGTNPAIAETTAQLQTAFTAYVSAQEAAATQAAEASFVTLGGVEARIEQDSGNAVIDFDLKSSDDLTDFGTTIESFTVPLGAGPRFFRFEAGTPAAQ